MLLNWRLDQTRQSKVWHLAKVHKNLWVSMPLGQLVQMWCHIYRPSLDQPYRCEVTSIGKYIITLALIRFLWFTLWWNSINAQPAFNITLFLMQFGETKLHQKWKVILLKTLRQPNNKYNSRATTPQRLDVPSHFSPSECIITELRRYSAVKCFNEIGWRAYDKWTASSTFVTTLLFYIPAQDFKCNSRCYNSGRRTMLSKFTPKNGLKQFLLCVGNRRHVSFVCRLLRF